MIVITYFKASGKLYTTAASDVDENCADAMTLQLRLQDRFNRGEWPGLSPGPHSFYAHCVSAQWNFSYLYVPKEESVPKKLRFQIVVKRSGHTTSIVTGLPDVVNADTLTVADVQRIPEVEAFLERLTGLRFHIEQLHESE